MMEWNQIPWLKLEKKVFKWLQKGIFRALKLNNIQGLNRLQKTSVELYLR